MNNPATRVGDQIVPVRAQGVLANAQPTTVLEVAAIVVQALIQGAHLPITTAIRTLIIDLTRTALEVSVELEDLRIQRKISLRGVVAARYNNALLSLEEDCSNWHPDVFQRHKDALILDLTKEINRRSAM